MENDIPPIWERMKMSEAQYKEIVKDSESKKSSLKSRIAKKIFRPSKGPASVNYKDSDLFPKYTNGK